MKRLAAFTAAACLFTMSSAADGPQGTGGHSTRGVVEHVVKIKLKTYDRLTLFLLMPENGKADGVLCLCMLGKDVADVKRRLLGESEDSRGYSRPLQFAKERNFAIVAWGARNLWDASLNWDEMPKAKARKIDADFDLVAKAWNTGINFFVKNYGIPPSGYLMRGSSAAGQYAQRLALRCPERFLAVHVHVSSSYDLPVKAGAEVLWCVTIGENELGYQRSRRFFRVARDLFYPIIYKAYPGLGHEGNGAVSRLGYACFEYALEEYERATRLNGGKPAKPDWADIFTSGPYIADVFNQAVYPKMEYPCVPPEFRMLIPSETIKEAWLEE